MTDSEPTPATALSESSNTRHESNSVLKNYLTICWAWRNTALIIGLPLALLPMVFSYEDDLEMQSAMRCAYVLIIMIIFWTAECLPLSMTALLPMLLYPLLSVVKAEDMAPQYMTESAMQFLGICLVVAAFQKAQLHNLFALRMLTIVGSQPRWLLSSFMFVSWFLSMWISNIMTTLLLVPIVLAVSAELRLAMKDAMTKPNDDAQVDGGQINDVAETVSNNSDDSSDDSKRSQSSSSNSSSDTDGEWAIRNYENMMLLSIAYCASIGGTVAIVGTIPNLVTKEAIEDAFREKGCPSPLNYLTWMLFTVPMTLLLMAFTWLWLQINFCGPAYAFGCRKSPLDLHRDRISKTIRQMYDALPSMNQLQIIVLVHCVVMILLLITRQLDTDPLIGWELIAPGYVKESTAILLIAISLFIFPTSLPKRNKITNKWIPPKVVISWTETERDYPFGLVLFLGGGIAIAYVAEESGFASLLADVFKDMVSELNELTTLLVLIISITFLTEFLSNTACVTLMMPVLKLMAESLESNPMLYMFPTGLATSLAFMLPVATVPNAIVYQTGSFTVANMAVIGFVVNIFAIANLYFASTTYGGAVLHLFDMPWVKNNATTSGYECK